MRLTALLAFVLLMAIPPAFAVQPDEVLNNPALEARARALSKDLRCLVCQNQSIDDSDADLARDLRILLRQRLTAGDTDQQAVDFIVARYGNFVLLKPPLHWNTILLWFGPGLLLAAAGFGFYRYATRHQTEPAPAKLSSEEETRLGQLLEDGPKQ